MVGTTLLFASFYGVLYWLVWRFKDITISKTGR
jgi:hypothetical protein